MGPLEKQIIDVIDNYVTDRSRQPKVSRRLALLDAMAVMHTVMRNLVRQLADEEYERTMKGE